jgi:tRNA(Ile)-lysidine synthase
VRLQQAVRDFCAQLDHHSTCWIAYSGGLDSQVLLSLFHELRAELNITFRAVHINHGISVNAHTWTRHCQQTCESLGVDFVAHSIQLNLQKGDSLEAAARAKRYDIFAEMLAVGDVLLTAHHEDDQAETMLLQLFRGSGIKGLSAMPVMKSFAKGFHGRPLLSFSRAELEQYAREQKLTWIEDESNQDTTLTRNFIRHDILTRLKSRWPSVTSSISRSASHCAENHKLLNDFSQEMKCEGSRKNTLSVAKLLQLTQEQQKFVLRAWIHQCHYLMPDTRKMQTILRDVLLASQDSQPQVKWGGVILRRHRDDLHLVPASNSFDKHAEFFWCVEGELHLPEVGCLKSSWVSGSGLRSDITDVVVRFRQGGEKIELPNRGRHTLKNLFQEWDVLPWERGCLPLIYAGDKIIAIPGYFLHADYAASVGGVGREIVFESRTVVPENTQPLSL